MAHDGDWAALTEELLLRHYDPAYTRAIISHYPRLPQAPRHTLAAHSAAAIAELAAGILAADC
jgi:hypothetical protein